LEGTRTHWVLYRDSCRRRENDKQAGQKTTQWLRKRTKSPWDAKTFPRALSNGNWGQREKWKAADQIKKNSNTPTDVGGSPGRA